MEADSPPNPISTVHCWSWKNSTQAGLEDVDGNLSYVAPSTYSAALDNVERGNPQFAQAMAPQMQRERHTPATAFKRLTLILFAIARN